MRDRLAETALALAVVVVFVVVLAVLPFASATHPTALPGSGSGTQPVTNPPLENATTTTEPTTTSTTEADTTAVGPPDTATVVARYPAENGSMVETTVLAPEDVARVDPPVNGTRTGVWRVQITLSRAGAERFTETLVDAGFTRNPGACPTTASRNDEGHCLLVLVDGDVRGAFSLGPQFAQSIESGAFEASPRFALAAESEREALEIWRGFIDDDRSLPTTPTTPTTTDGRTTSLTAEGERPPTDEPSPGDATTTNPTSARSPTVAGADGTTTGSTPGFGVLAAFAGPFAVVVLALAVDVGRSETR